MAILTYNGIVLPYSNCTQFDMRVKYDPLGNTDWFCTEFDIEVQCVINVNYLSALAPALIENNEPDTSNPADITNYIRTQLMRPRRKLNFFVNGVDLIPQHQGDSSGSQTLSGTVDAQNGPKPQACNIQQITDASFLLTYHVTANYWESPKVVLGSNPLIENTPGNPILYNRWSESLDLDDTLFTTRIRTGGFVMRSDNSQNLSAGFLLRNAAVFNVPKGFLRKSANYTIDPSGLGISYRIVDREVFKMPPKPAYKAEGEYQETGPGTGGTRHATCRLKLYGSPQTNQTDLLNLALSVVKEKFINASATSAAPVLGSPGLTVVNTNYIPDTVTVTVGMYENWVEVNASCWLLIQPVTKTDWAAFGGKVLTHTPRSDNVSLETNTPSYLPRSFAAEMLQAAKYYDPSLATVKLDEGTGNLTNGLFVGQAGVTKEA